MVAGGGESDETVSSHLDSIITFHACYIPGAKDASPEDEEEELATGLCVRTATRCCVLVAPMI